MRIAIVGAITAALVSASCAADPSPRERFLKASLEAKANAATPAGRSYDETIAVHFEKHNSEVLMQCFKTTPQPDAGPFEMVFEISSTGTPRSILVWPETNIALCFRDSLKTAAFPVPPKDRYLTFMEMSFGP